MNITFVFQSNPKPTNVKWIISIPSIVDSDNYTDLRNEDPETSNETSIVELTPGHEDDKYLVLYLEEDSITYTASMTILDLESLDHDDKYILEVENVVGVQRYYFEVNVEGGNDLNGGDGEGGDEEGGDDDDDAKDSSSQIAALVVIIGLITTAMLCAIFFVVYKKGQVHNETAPLSSLETRGH